ncbi:translation elongation factor 2 [Lentinula aciculospora]|uniref:Ribosome assembly protein 1 n=1 Tax=Lentinula aciculospora TaxID=153920 RepID=A0A9W9AG82_9AGAR|nr:translation elongation factor 2 [Lentinula aciculospora]
MTDPSSSTTSFTSQPANQNPLFVRNLTTLGHVDHGKTTLMDSLLASNNIISSRMAGKIRYMDSREDEQERGITMEASAVGLKYRVKDGDMYVMNMIDTPGHVDFQSEVSTASRLCDGALVLVDVVEGVQTQTTSLLRQAYQDQLTPILVINKIDRMITELKLTPEEAYERLTRVVEDVNVVMGGLWGGERMKKADISLDDGTVKNDDDDDDSGIYFDPAQGNVIFASAIDSWGFRPSHFARIFAKKLFAEQIQSGKLTADGLKEKEEGLKKVMWGEWYFDPKSKRVVGSKGKRSGMKTLFVQIVLENLWQVYDAVIGNPNPDKVLKIISSLSLTLPQRELRSLSNLISTSDTSLTNNYPKHLLSLIFAQWLPLATCIVQTVIDIVPPPQVAQGRRMGKMLGLANEPSSNANPSPYEHLYAASPLSTVPVCAYVSKMFAVRRADLPEEREKTKIAQAKAANDRKRVAAEKSNSTVELAVEGTQVEGDKVEEQIQENQDEDVLLGFARIYSGTLSPGERVLVLLSKFNPALESTKLSSQNDISITSIHPSNIPYVLGLPSSSSVFQPSPTAQPSVTNVNSSSHPTRMTIAGLYLMMGRELLPVPSVSAGQIFAARFKYEFTSSSDVSKEDQSIGSTKDKKKEVESVVWRGGTIVRPSSAQTTQKHQYLLNLGRITHSVPPIVRLSLLPAHPGDLPALLRGLRILEQADPCVETFQMDGGEWVIGGAGELHLERCLKDLRERFAKVEIHSSKPIVPFRETAVREAGNVESQQAGQSSVQQQQQQVAQHQQQKQFQTQFGGGSTGGPTGTISSSTSPNGIIQFTIRCVPFPSGIRDFLAGKRRRGVLTRLRRIQDGTKQPLEAIRETRETIAERIFWNEFQQVCQKEALRKERKHRDEGEQRLWSTLAERVLAFGPFGGERGSVSVEDVEERIVESELITNTMTTTEESESSDHSANSSRQNRNNSEFDLNANAGGTDAYGAGCVLVDARDTQNSNPNGLSDKFDPLPYILTGFQLATRQGPLCAEPVEGLAYFVEKVEVDWERLGVEVEQNRITQTTGSLISAVRDACRSAMLEWSPRLMLAMYSCDIQCSTDVLGRVYGVLSKRKGRVVAEEMNEGTSFFTITARLPVVESFGFADELRKRTSGAAGAMLVFSGYDLLPLSPFWVPSTIEELEDLGTTADRVNQAKFYMDGVRERKGMFVDRKLMMEPEKQRTLKK